METMIENAVEIPRDVFEEEFLQRAERLIGERMDAEVARQTAQLRAELAETKAKLAAPPVPKAEKDKKAWYDLLKQTALNFIESRRPDTEFWFICKQGRRYCSVYPIPSYMTESKHAPRLIPGVRLEFEEPKDLIVHTIKDLGDKNLYVCRMDISEHKEVRVEREDIAKYHLNPETVVIKDGEHSIADVLLEMQRKYLTDDGLLRDGLMTGENFRQWYEIMYRSTARKRQEREELEAAEKLFNNAQLKAGHLAKRGVGLLGTELVGAGAGTL